MLKHTIILLCAFSLTKQLCGPGCLQCGPAAICQMCDITKGYFLRGFQCEYFPIENCKTPSIDRLCAQCAANYFLDQSTKKCVAVDTRSLINKCHFYSNDQSCARCLEGYFVSQNKCELVTKVVTNCEVYLADGFCQLCSNGYRLTDDKRTCVINAVIKRCMAHSFVKCSKCVAGYDLNSNPHLEDSSTAYAYILSMIMKSTETISEPIQLRMCQKTRSSSRGKKNSFECPEGYFLASSKTCQPNPFPPIANCIIYNNVSSCAKCKPGFYLANPANCKRIKPHETIPECIQYDNKAPKVSCMRCSPNRYLKNSNCFSLRVDSKSIEHCEQTSLDSDACASCLSGYVLTFDGKKCLPEIRWCAEYSRIIDSSLDLACDRCQNGYFVHRNSDGMTVCNEGGIVGCLRYSSATVCLYCDATKYYLKENTCVKHPVVDKCLRYSETDFGICNQCAFGHYPFKLQETCQSASNVLTHCAIYDNITEKCLECQTGCVLKEDHTCVRLERIPANCSEAEGPSECRVCQNGFAKTTDNRCLFNHAYITEYCEKVSPGAVFKKANEPEKNQCSVCKKGSYPFDLSGQFICIRRDLAATRGPQLIQGCHRHSYGKASSLICSECESGRFLYFPNEDSENGICIDACDPVTDTYVELDPIEARIRVCQSQSANGQYSMPKCAEVVIGTIKSCIKLRDYIDTSVVKLVIVSMNPPDDSSFYKDFAGSTVPKPDSDFSWHGFPLKVSEEGHDLHTSTINSNESESATLEDIKCELYYKTGDKYVCWRCKWGFTVHYEAGSVTSCTKFDCDTTKVFGGFSSALNQLLSCHACQSQTKILTLFLSGKNEEDSFKITGHVAAKDTLQCLTPANFSSSSTPDQPKFIEKCVVYANIYDDITLAFVAERSGCVACEPGHRPDDSTKMVFAKCLPIIGCDLNQSLYVNRCHTCVKSQSNSPGTHLAFRDLALNFCQMTNTPNCFLNEGQTNEPTSNCKVCFPGFVLSNDKYCEVVTLPQCVDSQPPTLHKTTTKDANSLGLHYALKKLAKNKSINGCDSCRADSILFKLPQGERQCIGSSYINSDALAQTFPSHYVHECSHYKNEFKESSEVSTGCVSCKHLMKPTLDGSKCVMNSDYSCEFARNDGQGCHQCIGTHVPIKGECILKSIEHCAKYDESENVVDLLCVECDDGFVLSRNQKRCSPGIINGCKKYDAKQPEICLECQTGFGLLKMANSKTYCIKASTELNCRNLDQSYSSGLQGGFIRCLACKSNDENALISRPYPKTDPSKPQSVCVQLNLIENCVEYDSSSANLVENSFMCLQCEQGFFYDESTRRCQRRTLTIPNCIEYAKSSEKCTKCSSKTILSDDGAICFERLTGVAYCSVYLNETSCKYCSKPFYLSNNECILSETINHCKIYASNKKCLACEQGYFLVNPSSCVAAIARDCYTYHSIDRCASCDPNLSNKGLKTEDGVTSCVDKNVPDCSISTSEYPFKCMLCNSGYYLTKGGNCRLSDLIPRCLIYYTKTTCAVCEQGSVLALDKKSCETTIHSSEIDPNCADSQLLESPMCVVCEPGYIMSGNECVKCKIQTLEKGCLWCDPNDQNTCLICRPEFYQNEQGECIVQTALVTQDKESISKSTFAFSLPWIWLALIVLF